MNLIVERSHVWVAGYQDSPSGLAQVLGILRDAGADLDFILARRDAEHPGRGVVFVTPLRGDHEVAAAAEAGFCVANSIHSVRIQGQNEPGLAAVIAQKLADADICARGMSAAELGTRFVMYIGFNDEADAERAVEVLQQGCATECDSGWERSAA